MGTWESTVSILQKNGCVIHKELKEVPSHSYFHDIIMT